MTTLTRTIDPPAPAASRQATLSDCALAGLALFAAPGEAGSAPAAAALGAPAAPPSSAAPELAWLDGYAAALGVATGSWARAVERVIARPSPGDEPLVALGRTLGLAPLELLAVALAAAVEEDVLIGRAVAHLQAPLGGSRPTIGLLVAAFAGALGAGAHAVDTLVMGPAAGAGLLAIAADGGPLPERAVSVPPHLCVALHGADGAVPGTAIGLPPEARIRLPDSLLADAARHAEALWGGGRQILVIRSASASEARAVADALAAALRRRTLFLEQESVPGLAPWLLLRGLLPVFCLDPGPGERKVLSRIPLYDGPGLVLSGPDGFIDGAGAPVAQWTVPVPSIAERSGLWVAELGDEAVADDLARHHRHGAGRIAELGPLARHRATLEGRSAASLEDVAEAAWSIEGGGLDALAHPIRDRIPDDAFVCTPALAEDLERLLLRCRSRDGLVAGLGASAVARYRPGVRALFVGPSGTGKSLAAAWLATRLGLPLFGVDLAAVTSKYIGETEKNLAQLLARAEQAEILLLFDEADSLFGKRTDVKDANDRFANAQTNYLLQRIETFEGIALLTSNSRARFDSAFTRRLDVVIDFPLPGPDERLALWVSHLGDEHRLEPVELNQLAAGVDLPGGHIRNVVLTGAVLARQDGGAVAFRHIVRALAAEYHKLGRQLPAGMRV